MGLDATESSIGAAGLLLTVVGYLVGAGALTVLGLYVRASPSASS